MEPSTSTTTIEVLWLASSQTENEQALIITDKNVHDLPLRLLVHIFMKEGDKGYGDTQVNGIDLRGVTTVLDSYPRIDIGETIAIKE